MKMALKPRAVLLVLGSLLFIYLLLRLGPGEILSLLLQIGWSFLWIAAAYLGHQVVRAAALGRCVAVPHRLSFWDLVKIRLSGETVQFLTSTGPFLAEPTRAWLLKRSGLNVPQGFAAAISEFLIYTFTSAAMTVAGMAYLLSHFELSQASSSAAIGIGGGAVVFLLIAAFAILRRIYLIGAILNWLAKLPWLRNRLRIDSAVLRDTEDLLFVVLRDSPRRFLSIVALEFASQAFLVAELFVLLRVTGQPFSAIHPLLIESSTKFIGLAFFFIPGQVGASEGAYAWIFQALGFTASAGFSLALARRLRGLLIAGIGLALLSRSNLSHSSEDRRKTRMPVGVLIGVVLGVAVLAHTAPFPFIFDAFSGNISMWRMPQTSGQQTVYLTFDDGPNPTATPDLLDLLREQKVPATFFLIDGHVTDSTAPIVRRMFEEGHAVAQHSGNRWQILYSPNRLASELQASADRMEALAGHRPCPLFRPHGGWRSVPMLLGLGRAHYKLVGWSWMSWDWVWFRKRTPERVSAQVLANAAPGKIIVLHDGHHIDPQADRHYTIEAARRVIDELRRRGYTFAALCGAA